jgi:hypothetical protein
MARISTMPKISELVDAGLIAKADPQPNSLGFPPIPALPTAKGPSYRGPLAPGDQFDVSSLAQWHSPTVPQTRVFPTQPAQSAQAGASVQSTATPIVVAAVAPVIVQAAAAQTTANSAQALATALQATSFQGTYNAGVSYSQGASVVDGSGNIFISLVNGNIGNTPSTSPADWAATGASEIYDGVWNNATAYTIGNLVSVSSQIFIALQNSINQNPSTTNGFWQLINSTASAWSSATQYQIGSVVTNNGSSESESNAANPSNSEHCVLDSTIFRDGGPERRASSREGLNPSIFEQRISIHGHD